MFNHHLFNTQPASSEGRNGEPHTTCTLLIREIFLISYHRLISLLSTFAKQNEIYKQEGIVLTETTVLYIKMTPCQEITTPTFRSFCQQKTPLRK
jgi:hypothetical protein